MKTNLVCIQDREGTVMLRSRTRENPPFLYYYYLCERQSRSNCTAVHYKKMYISCDLLRKLCCSEALMQGISFLLSINGMRPNAECFLGQKHKGRTSHRGMKSKFKTG